MKKDFNELYADLDQRELLKIVLDKTIENINLSHKIKIGVNFIRELIDKEITQKKKLSENLDLYKTLNRKKEYESTFSLWNKQTLIIWDLKDILCRMGEDINDEI